VLEANACLLSFCARALRVFYKTTLSKLGSAMAHNPSKRTHQLGVEVEVEVSTISKSFPWKM
jgi:hypothetical protein